MSDLQELETNGNPQHYKTPTQNATAYYHCGVRKFQNQLSLAA